MNIFNLCEPEYLAQSKAVLHWAFEPIFHSMMAALPNNTAMIIPIIIVGFFFVPFALIALAWGLHPVVGILLVAWFFIPSEKDKKKAEGKWTAQDETNEKIDEMDWNNLVMNHQILEQLKVIAESSRRK